MVHSAGFGADGVLAGGPANSRFVKIRDLSRGAYGCVVLALNTQTGQQVALKFIERGKENISSKYVEREIINHMKLRHPHIVELQEVFLTTTHLVSVRASGGSPPGTLGGSLQHPGQQSRRCQGAGRREREPGGAGQAAALAMGGVCSSPGWSGTGSIDGRRSATGSRFRPPSAPPPTHAAACSHRC
ncbi:hypothetical protein ABPG77_004881 [Micractinium sp. CCAP 211/92]